MHWYKYYSVLQKYTKLEELKNDFSSLIFDQDTYCISLSGGVDSMVLMDILLKRNKKIIAVHINYNNRDESKIEEDFLRDYCKPRNIEFICHSFNIKRGSINRNKYETLTKNIRFGIYKKVLEDNNLDYILLAHHKDDIIENIFTNFCKGNNFLNLSVIKEYNTILNVNILRPLINYYKKDIYDYAHYYEVPYFLDTTPDWSVRGKFRNNILPILYDTFAGENGIKTNLLSIAKESDEWGSLIQSKFIDKYMSNIKFNDNIIEMPLNISEEDYSEYPLCFWSVIFVKVLHKYNISAPTRKSLNVFISAIKNKKETKILLKHGVNLILEKKSIYIYINS
jgi:tRNA(Ile)-lysidine synthetase-like protein